MKLVYSCWQLNYVFSIDNSNVTTTPLKKEFQIIWLSHIIGSSRISFVFHLLKSSLNTMNITTSKEWWGSRNLN